MQAVKVIGEIDQQGRLSVHVPASVAPGKVSVIVLGPVSEDDAGDAWMMGVAQEWHDDLADSRQDIYTLNDGAPVDDRV